MLYCINKEPSGGLDICVDGQAVLNISEVSDNETINLFLTPMGVDAVIIETMECTRQKMPWSHELLVRRR